VLELDVKKDGTWISKRLNDVLSLNSMVAARIRELALKTEGVIKLTSGEPNFQTPNHIVDAAKRALDEGDIFYTPTSGIPEFRRVIAEKIAREHGVEVDSDNNILATPGAIEGIFLAIMGAVNPGNEVLIPDPCYVGYPSCIRFAGGSPIPIPLSADDDFRLNPVELERRITPSSRMIVLNSPSNPTGMILADRDLKAIAEIAKKHDLLVLTDEAYEKIVYDGVKHKSILSISGMKERTILIGSFSKTYAMTGWRIGYLVGPESLVPALKKIQSAIVLCTNGIVQKAAVAALTGPQNCVSEMVDEYDRRRRFIVQRLNEIAGFSCRMPKGAFYVLPDVTELKVGSLKLAEFLLKKAKVAVYPGIAYGQQGEHYIRLSYAASLSDIKTALDRIETALEHNIPN
jgi:aspartate/methionine/tyrosine aminotransferase